MDALRRASAPLFYFLGSIAIVAVVLVHRGIYGGLLTTLLNIIDLPLAFFAMLLGGSTLAVSVSRDGKPSVLVSAVIFLPLVVFFSFFAYLNFAMPFAELWREFLADPVQ